MSVTCDYCQCDIVDGHDYYDIDGTIICEECISTFKKTVEDEEYDV